MTNAHPILKADRVSPGNESEIEPAIPDGIRSNQNGGIFSLSQHFRSKLSVFLYEDGNMIKTNKFLRLKTKTGRLLDVVREHYLRKDVPCHSEVCAVCEQGRHHVMTMSTECIFVCFTSLYVIHCPTYLQVMEPSFSRH